MPSSLAGCLSARKKVKYITACYRYRLRGWAGVSFLMKQHHSQSPLAIKADQRVEQVTLIQDIQGQACFVTLSFDLHLWLILLLWSLSPKPLTGDAQMYVCHSRKKTELSEHCKQLQEPKASSDSPKRVFFINYGHTRCQIMSLLWSLPLLTEEFNLYPLPNQPLPTQCSLFFPYFMSQFWCTLRTLKCRQRTQPVICSQQAHCVNCMENLLVLVMLLGITKGYQYWLIPFFSPINNCLQLSLLC